MSIQDYNDGYMGKRRTPNPFSPTGSAADHNAGVSARQRAQQNFNASFVLPERTKPAAPAFRNIAAAPRPRRPRTPVTFERAAADLLGIAVGGLLLFMGIELYHAAPALVFFLALAAGAITVKLFRGPLRGLLVAFKFLLKAAFLLTGAALFVYVLIEASRK